MEISDERKSTAKSNGNGFFKKIKGIKNIQIIAVVFIIAIGLIIYSTVSTSKSSGGTDTAVSTVMTADEQRLSAILSNIDGAGKVEAMITKQGDTVMGVLVIADGASDILVRVRLIEAAATALGVNKQVVNVYSRK
ncbi:MAG: hypothetical protein HDT36_03495 [Clostridiales bacterium]|nr:hypothetical protein [Clostridiales bacterium]